jgi:hypothetical protein
MNEICICAAVIAHDGTIYRGHRHVDCLKAIRERGKKQEEKAEAQGFITSKNRYVNRAEGYKIQIAAGIKSADYTGDYVQKGQLYSEDLY